MSTHVTLSAPTLVALFGIFLGLCPAASSAPKITFDVGETALHVHIGQQRIATYVWQDAELPRPYFRSLTTLDGTPVTRNYPPDPVIDKNNDDHSHFHPGAWMAFGDISGADFWRNKARVRHVRFVGEASIRENSATFTVVNAYESTGESARIICKEICTYTFTLHADGYLLTVDSTFRPVSGAFAFGDQEEMGFGIRMATPLTVRHGDGQIRNSTGGNQEAGTWGQSADWCAGFGKRNDRWVGINVMAAPDNFRSSWFHSRDYGLIVANPFGKKAMTAPSDPSVANDSTPVAKDGALRVRFGIRVFSVPDKTEPNLGAMFETYTESLRE